MSSFKKIHMSVIFVGIAPLLFACELSEHERRSCDASNELDFSPVKVMAGTWKGPGSWALLFEEDGRPYSFEQGSRFGCSPGHYPLVLNDPNLIKDFQGEVRTTLVSALIEENHFVLSYDADVGPARIEVRLLDTERLEYIFENDPPDIFTRICDNLCDPKTGLPLDDESSE